MTISAAQFVISVTGRPDHLHSLRGDNCELGTRYGLKMLSLLGYKTEAAKSQRCRQLWSFFAEWNNH
jgi:hypothetical protein